MVKKKGPSPDLCFFGQIVVISDKKTLLYQTVILRGQQAEAMIFGWCHARPKLTHQNCNKKSWLTKILHLRNLRQSYVVSSKILSLLFGDLFRCPVKRPLSPKEDARHRSAGTKDDGCYHVPQRDQGGLFNIGCEPKSSK